LQTRKLSVQCGVPGRKRQWFAPKYAGWDVKQKRRALFFLL